MFKDRDEMVFYALSGIALTLAMWGFGLFNLRAYPIAILLLLSAFCLNFLLVYLGKGILGEGAGDAPIKLVAACGILAFVVVVIASPERQVLGTLALPTFVMFLAPSLLYYVRDAISRSGSDVQPK